MKVLITGASGFVGSRLAEYLIEKGKYTVVGTGRSAPAQKKFASINVEYKKGNLLDAAFVAKLIEDVDVVVHAAARSAVLGNYRTFYEANVQPTENLLQAIQKHDRAIRFIQISSGSVYVQMKDQFNIKEDFVPERFINHYAATKYQADQLVLAAIEKGLEAIILRPRAIYGRGDHTIMPRILKAHKTGRLKIIGKGDNLCSMTTIQNFCTAIELAIETQAPTALGQIYNITNEETVKLWEVIRIVFEKLNLEWNARKIPYWAVKRVAWIMETATELMNSDTEPDLTVYGVSQLKFSNTFSIEKAKRLLGYTPPQSVMDGVDEFVNWWKSKNV